MYKDLYIAKAIDARLVASGQLRPTGSSKRSKADYDMIVASGKEATAELRRVVSEIHRLSCDVKLDAPRSVLNRAIVKHVNGTENGVTYVMIILMREILGVVSEIIQPGTRPNALLLVAYNRAKAAIEKRDYWMQPTFLRRPTADIVAELLNCVAAIGFNIRSTSGQLMAA